MDNIELLKAYIPGVCSLSDMMYAHKMSLARRDVMSKSLSELTAAYERYRHKVAPNNQLKRKHLPKRRNNGKRKKAKGL